LTWNLKTTTTFAQTPVRASLMPNHHWVRLITMAVRPGETGFKIGLYGDGKY
jgi:hypothetical protein